MLEAVVAGAAARRLEVVPAAADGPEGRRGRGGGGGRRGFLEGGGRLHGAATNITIVVGCCISVRI